MKLIPIRGGGDGAFSTLAIIRDVAGAAPHGINITQMRARIRVLDALDKAEGDRLVLEDADHETLVQAVNAMTWARADRDLLQIIDDILTATTPPAA